MAGVRLDYHRLRSHAFVAVTLFLSADMRGSSPPAVARRNGITACRNERFQKPDDLHQGGRDGLPVAVVCVALCARVRVAH